MPRTWQDKRNMLIIGACYLRAPPAQGEYAYVSSLRPATIDRSGSKQ